LIVSNIANLFVKNVKFYDWDIMPAVLMLKELNYFVSDLKGNQIKLSSNLKKTKGLIVTNNKQLLKKTLKLKLHDK
jgi:fructose-1,6-bisphosphatase/inositol monophosphatase family enzyme